MGWHIITSNGGFHGPISYEEVVAGIGVGRLSAESMVKRDGTEEWLALGEVGEFHQALKEGIKATPVKPPESSALSQSTAVEAGIKYDPIVIKDFAAGLYAEAEAVSVRAGIRGLLIGGFLGGVAGLVVVHDQTMAMVGAILIGALGYVFGASSAAAQAFALRLQAQTALCQVEIEKNTRSR